MRLKPSSLTHNEMNKWVEHCVAGTPARSAALLVGVNKDTAASFYHRLRLIIHARLHQEAAELAGEVEVDESYVGGVRKGKRGRGAAGKSLPRRRPGFPSSVCSSRAGKSSP